MTEQKRVEVPKVGVVVTHHTFDRLPMLIDLLHALNCQTFRTFNIYIIDDSKIPDIFDPYYKDVASGHIPRVMQRVGTGNYKKSSFIRFDSKIMQGRPLEAFRINGSVKIFTTGGGFGASKACNFGIDEALKDGCEIIRIIDGDDVPLFMAIEEQLKVLLSNDSINCVTSDKLEFGINHSGYQSKASNDPDGMIAQSLFWGSLIYKTAVMFKTSILEKCVGGKLFDDEFTGIGDDIVMNAQFGRVGGIAYIPLPLVYYRRHGDNLSHMLLQSFERDYAKSIRHNFRHNCGIEVSEKFSRRWYNTFHMLQHTQYMEEFMEEAIGYLRLSKYGKVDKLIEVALGAKQHLIDKPVIYIKEIE